jgi:hypothetical protein
MTNDTILFDPNYSAKTIFFFGKSQRNGEITLFRDRANPYTIELMTKNVIVDRKLNKFLPDYCYLKINEAIEKEKAFVITNAELITSNKTTEEEIYGMDLVERPIFTIDDDIKYYNAKSILGNIDCLVVTYKLLLEKYKGYTYYNCFINHYGKIIKVEAPINKRSRIPNYVEDFSTLYFKDFELFERSFLMEKYPEYKEIILKLTK